MKNYFDFHLQAKKLVLFYLMIFIFIVMPYAWIVYSFIQKFNQEPEGLIIMIPVIVFMLLAMLALNFYFFKLFLENISYQDEKLNFKGDFSAYLGQILLGLLLSIITLGIYYPWFMKRIYRFFATNTEYKEESFDFMSKGFKLFLIMLLTLIIPMFIFTLYVKMEGIDISTKSPLNYYISQIIKSIILIPYLYYYYKWIINFKYRDFQIKMKAKFWPAAGKITIEMLLAVLTLGIYFPLAYLRLYKFFIENSRAENDEKQFELGYDLNNLNDFLYVWGQALLTIITLGIYLPWSTVKIYRRVISKTYILSE